MQQRCSTISFASLSANIIRLGHLSERNFAAKMLGLSTASLWAILVIAMCLVVPHSGHAQCTSTQSGLLALYANGSPTDIAGYNYGYNNASLVNTPAYVSDATFGSVLQLNGTNQYMSLPNGIVQDEGTFSISVWFQTTSRGVLFGMQNASFVSGSSPTASYGPVLYVGTDGHLYSGMWAQGANNPVTIPPTGQGPAVVNDGKWHHAVLTVTTNLGSAGESLYLDGTLASSASTGTWVFSTTNMPFNQIGIGYTLNYNNSNPGWFPFTGLIGEVAIYNYALSGADVQSLFAANASGVCTPSQELVTANADSIAPGTPFSILNLGFTVSPGAPNWTLAPSCYSSANGASLPFPAFYGNAINCYGAAAPGYAITYRANTLTLGTPSPGSDPVIEPDAYVAQPYQQSASIPNATAGSTYSLGGGNPPPGIGIKSDGRLYGFPTNAGEYSFAVNWSDGTNSGSQPVRMKVLPGFGDLITSTSDSNYTSGSVYRVDPNSGVAITIANLSTNVVDVAVGPSNGTTYALSSAGTVYAITSSGAVSTFYSNATLGSTNAIAVDMHSNVYFATTSSIYKLNQSAQLVDVLGNVTGTAMMANPVGGTNLPRMIFDRDGNLVISGDSAGNPTVVSIVLTAASQFPTTVYAASSAGNIVGMTFARDGSGDLILADGQNKSIIRISQYRAANVVQTIMTGPSAFSPGLVGIVAGTPTPFNEYYVGMTTGTGTYKVVPQTAGTLYVNGYTQTHQTAITWSRYNQPAITIQPPPTGLNVGTAYSFSLQASGGNGHYTWSETGFPPGLSLSSSGAVSGTPTTAGTYTVTVQVSDTIGNSGGGTYNINVSTGGQQLLITANNQVETYGGIPPAPTYSVTPTGVALTTPPSCGYVGLPSSLVVGTYEGVITCGGATANGYTISYASGSLTVNPAPLTVTANSFVTPYGTALPTLSATITGFVNGEIATTATAGTPALNVNVPAGNPAGTYTITVTQGTLSASNYIFSSFVPGTLTITPVQQTPTLTLLNNYIVTGDYVARNIDAGFSADPATGLMATTITIPSQGQAPDGVPSGAEVVAAYLYWQTLETTATPSSSNGMFNRYNIHGNSVGNDLTSGCWTSATPAGTVVRAYRSKITAFLPVVNGSYNPVGTFAVELPPNAYGNGATLVVIYRLMSPNSPTRATVVYEGNWSEEYPPGFTSTFNLNLTGFYDSNLSLGTARVTDITGFANTSGNFSFLPAQSQTTTLALPDASASVAMPNNFGALQSGQCRIWTATVLSTGVHASDNDNLIDSWKTGPTSPNDPNYHKAGYYDATTGTWVDLAGAALGQRDLFVQLDYMVGADGHSHLPTQNALGMVQNALSAHGITPHFIVGNQIPEDICSGTSTDSSGNTLYCVFPNQYGVVAWKVGLEDLKTTVVNAATCAANPVASNPACQPRFPFGRRHSYRYVLFGHSLGIANWTINDGTLSNIVVSGNTGTVNLTVPFKTCPNTVTITNAMVTLGLNGTYTVNSCPTNQSFTITTTNVASNTYPIPGGVPEPALAIINGTTGTISGYSDIGGSDSVVTLGNWGADGLRDNVTAGTLMHELGHTLGLGHGGSYNGFGTAATYGANCKPNYQSVMNYLFQIDLLGPNGVVDYSSQNLNYLDKSLLGTSITGLTTTSNTAPLYSITSWYAPNPPYGTGTPARRRCNGTIPKPGEYGYLLNGGSTTIPWFSGQDVNFDGLTSELLYGYDDWSWVDFRQIGATGSEVLLYPIGLSDGGIQLSGGGGIQRVGGGGIQLSGGGGIQLSGGGGIQLSGGGGIQLSGGGGIQLSGGGGIQLAGGGGIQLSGGGGVDSELKYETANAVVHPPRNVTTSGNTVTWFAAMFGNVVSYNIYRSTNGATPVLIASVPSVIGQTQYSYPDTTATTSNTYVYFVTTVVKDADGTLRESTVPNPQPTLKNQTITFPNPGPLYFTTQGITLTATASSGLPVSYTATPSNVCNVSGSTLHFVSAGTCSVTASQGGSLFVNPATPVIDQVVATPWTIVGFTSPVVMPNPNIVWNVVKAGQTVPLKFNVYIGTVQQQSTSVVVGQTASIAPAVCGAGTTSTDTAVTNTGNTALTWDGSEFIQNWKTPSTSGLCYAVSVTTLDGSKITAYFQTK